MQRSIYRVLERKPFSRACTAQQHGLRKSFSSKKKWFLNTFEQNCIEVLLICLLIDWFSNTKDFHEKVHLNFLIKMHQRKYVKPSKTSIFFMKMCLICERFVCYTPYHNHKMNLMWQTAAYMKLKTLFVEILFFKEVNFTLH